MRASLLIIILVFLSGITIKSLAKDIRPLPVEVEYNDLKIEGILDRESVRRKINSKRNEFEACGLTKGKLDLSFHVSENGGITDSNAVIAPNRDRETEACFKAVLSKVDFANAGVESKAKISITFEIGKAITWKKARQDTIKAVAPNQKTKIDKHNENKH